VGHLFGPEVYIERTWSKFGTFHVTCPLTHCPPRQHARLAIALAPPVCPWGGLDGRRAQEGRRAPSPPPTGPFRVCPNMSPANWPIWVCPKDLGVSKRSGCVQNGPLKPKPPPPRPPSGPQGPRPAYGGPGPGPRPSCSKYISLVQGRVVNPSQVLPHPPGYISLLMTTPPAGSTPPWSPATGLPGPQATARGLRGRGRAPGSPSTGQCRGCPNSLHQLASLGCVQNDPGSG
jgi:hypothetical protein